MKRLILTLPYIAVLVLSILLFKSSQNVSASTIPPVRYRCGTWNVVASPNPGTSSNFLNGVAALSAKNAWAVGAYGNGNGSVTLVEQWNGTQWSVVASPNVSGALSDTLSAVVALSTSNAWAVGSYQNAANVQQTLIEHWNGTAWTIIASPNIPSLFNTLTAVSAVSANDIWAVGNASGANGFQVLIEHWNGTTWSIVPLSASGQLTSVVALNAKNIWAVGSVASTNSSQVLIEHWNGHKWSTMSGINPGMAGNTLNSITANAANDVWVVGNYTNSVGPRAEYVPLIEHWNGQAWSVVNSLTIGTSELISAVTTISAHDMWLFGDYRESLDPMGPYYTLIEHWNGTAWSIVKSPSPGSIASDLVAAAHVPGTSAIWTVGFTQGTLYQTLTASRC